MTCDDNNLFLVQNYDFLVIFCYVMIFFCLFFSMMIIVCRINQKRSLLLKKIFTFIGLFLFLIFLILIFLNSFYENRREGCFCKVSTEIDSDKLILEKKEIKKIGANKVIIVGDSRMEFIVDGKHGRFDIPSNFTFVAKSGAEIDWLETNAINKLEKELEKCKKLKCHVVFNLGVNDFYTKTDVSEIVDNYFDDYKELAIKYPNVTFYFLSVNPIKENAVREYFPYLKATSMFIEEFNSMMFNDVKKLNVNNFKVCDSYHALKFQSRDGLHYDRSTGQNILNYITNHCIIYE